MSEPIKVFGIEDYQHYFASAAISSETDNQASTEINVPSEETTEVVPESETGTLQNIETNTHSMVNISVTVVIALGLLVGIQMGKIFLDKIWR